MPPMIRKNINYGKKEKTDFKSLKKLFLYCKPYFPAIFISVLLAVGGSIATILGPEKISDFINLVKDSILLGVDMSALFDIGIFLVLLYLGGFVLSYGHQLIMATVTQKASKRLRSDINKKINKVPLSYFDKTTKGDILSRVTNDVDIISQTLSSSVANLVSSLVLFVGLIFKMFQTNWILSLVTIGASVFGFFFTALILAKSQKYFNRRQVYLGEMNGHIEEIYSNHKVVKAFNSIKKEKETFEKNNQNIYLSEWKSQFLSGMMQPIMKFIGDLSYVLVFVVGIAIILGGGTGVNLGVLTAFIIYARLFSQPLRTFAQSMTSIQQASAASKRVFELLDAKELEGEEEKIEKLGKVQGNVLFEHVKFGYNRNQLIIKDFNADLKAGQKIAIVGPTGAGKTTLVNLLMRFYEVDDGDIKIDGKSIKGMKRETVHDLFDMILQDTWLFGGTLRENLIYNQKNITDEDLDRVCEAVGLKYFVNTLPKKYDTIIDDYSALSEGQKQQITIARAMLKDSPLLILDEATSNVDTRTELEIQKAMDKLTKNRTSFVIAHRLSTIKNADIILVLKDGDIVEQGNHKQLLKKKGFYAELYNSQFQNV